MLRIEFPDGPGDDSALEGIDWGMVVRGRIAVRAEVDGHAIFEQEHPLRALHFRLLRCRLWLLATGFSVQAHQQKAN